MDIETTGVDEAAHARRARSRRGGFRVSGRAPLAIAVLAAAACSVADPSGSGIHPRSNGRGDGEATAGGEGGGGEPGAGGGNAGNGAAAGFAPAAMRRLSAVQYANSVRDLVGDVTMPDLEADTAIDGFVAIASSKLTVSPRSVELYENAALAIARQAFEDRARREALLGCAPTGPDDEACARRFVASFGRRAFRRSLAPDEVARYAGVALEAAKASGDAASAFAYAAAALLQSPNFLYRVEVGEPDPASPGRRRYASVEMASRLSYALWNTTPDDALLDVAEAGELTEPGPLAAQIERLLASPRAEAAIANFATEWFDLDRLASEGKEAAVFPTLTRSVRVGMRREVDELFLDTFRSGGDLLDLFTTKKTFVDPELAAFYGLPAPAGAAPGVPVAVTLPDGSPRRGLLGTGGFLLLHGKPTDTSPTQRGKFVRNTILCQTIPSPPPGVATMIPPAPEGVAETKREELARHRTDPTCAACHALMDPIGLAFENFDAVGRFRADDRGMAIDTRGEFGARVFAGPGELAEVLREAPEVRACFVRSVYRYAVGHLETKAEEPLVLGLLRGFEDGHRLRELVAAIARSDGFRFAAPEAP